MATQPGRRGVHHRPLPSYRRPLPQPSRWADASFPGIL